MPWCVRHHIAPRAALLRCQTRRRRFELALGYRFEITRAVRRHVVCPLQMMQGGRLAWHQSINRVWGSKTKNRFKCRSRPNRFFRVRVSAGFRNRRRGWRFFYRGRLWSSPADFANRTKAPDLHCAVSCGRRRSRSSRGRRHHWRRTRTADAARGTPGAAVASGGRKFATVKGGRHRRRHGVRRDRARQARDAPGDGWAKIFRDF